MVLANSSYIWQSLMARKKVVDMGSYFLVGDCYLINVAFDPWVPSLPNYVLQDPFDSWIYGLKVGYLIYREIGEWKVDVLHDLFDEQTTKAILEINLEVWIS